MTTRHWLLAGRDERDSADLTEAERLEGLAREIAARAQEGQPYLAPTRSANLYAALQQRISPQSDDLRALLASVAGKEAQEAVAVLHQEVLLLHQAVLAAGAELYRIDQNLRDHRAKIGREQIRPIQEALVRVARAATVQQIERATEE